MLKKIVLVGEGGQGIKLMAHVLANVLTMLGKEVSFNPAYGAQVRGGESKAELIYSDEKIEVPLIDEADIRVQLARVPKEHDFRTKKLIVEDTACGSECKDCEFACHARERIPFNRIASEEFGNPLFVNMIALGNLLSQIGIDMDEVDFQSILPARFFQENLKAIRYGYTYREHY